MTSPATSKKLSGALSRDTQRSLPIRFQLVCKKIVSVYISEPASMSVVFASVFVCVSVFVSVLVCLSSLCLFCIPVRLCVCRFLSAVLCLHISVCRLCVSMCLSVVFLVCIRLSVRLCVCMFYMSDRFCVSLLYLFFCPCSSVCVYLSVFVCLCLPVSL